MVFAPSTQEKLGHTNSVTYAEHIISFVRVHYAGVHGRLPGLSTRDLGGKQLRYTFNGLRKLVPKVKKGSDQSSKLNYVACARY